MGMNLRSNQALSNRTEELIFLSIEVLRTAGSVPSTEEILNGRRHRELREGCDLTELVRGFGPDELLPLLGLFRVGVFDPDEHLRLERSGESLVDSVLLATAGCWSGAPVKNAFSHMLI